MKFQEQQLKSIDNMRKRYNAANQKDLLNDYQSAIAHKRKLQGIEKQIEHRQAKNLEQTAQQSLYNENSQRKEMLSKFKDEFRKDYEDRYS